MLAIVLALASAIGYGGSDFAATNTPLTADASSVIWMTGALREARPAAKSEPP